MTGSLSDGVGILTIDQRHERVRRQIRSEAMSSSGQLMAGIKGLGHGLMGGITSVVSQTYYGAKDDGLEVKILWKNYKIWIGNFDLYNVNPIQFTRRILNNFR